MSELETQLLSDTRSLAMPHGRRVGQKGHDQAQQYLVSRLNEIGLKPFWETSFPIPYHGQLHHSGKDHTFNNIVGVAPGTDRSLPPLLIGAHYDSVIDAPCADDNATSVALNLAIAERAIKSPFRRDLIVALYDAEEPPYFLSPQMGSTRFFEDHFFKIDYAGAVVTDLIGHDLALNDLLDLPETFSGMFGEISKIVFMTGAESDGVFPDLVETVSKNHPNLLIFPTLNSYTGSLSDHHVLAKNSKPFLFFSCGQGRYYHHEKDNLEWINFTKLANLVDFIFELLVNLDTSPAGQLPTSTDPADFEIRMIKRILGGSGVEPLLSSVGLSLPRNRADLDQFIGALLDGLK